ncbi:MAG: peptidylprolyl isomerase [Betaproteobacteria bacterium]|jgi:peptidyl-prolyl cis-trans isomerase A (cyclophilin A)/peptidyl-prolyl cis-trans isomerase B (cyclophilin B)|nr:peptidylprolyl isomerase [Casimicrobiaceae bacterium]
MHRLLSLLFAAALAVAAGPSLAANPQVELETSAGAIKLELYPDATPKTVENFLKYVNAGHYNGTQFHRVIKGFMIQGGGYDSEFRQRPTRPPIAIEAEQSVKAGLSNKPGTVAMARTGDPNSAQSQFFINVGDNKRLDFRSPDAQGYGYTVFGKVISGMDVVEKIAQAPTGAAGPFPTDVPTERVVIKSARVLTPAS